MQYFIFLKYCILYFYKINNVKLIIILVNMGYKRYGSSISIPQFEEEEGEGVSRELSQRSPSKTIYFGIKKPKADSDSNRPWRELTSADFNIQITSDTSGCSATIKKNTTDDTNKTGIITYTLSKNSTGSQRLITFKYKDTVLFKILQDPSEEDNNTYVYLCEYNYKYDICIVSKSSDYLGIADIDISDSKKEIILKGVRGLNLYYHVSNNNASVINLIDNKSISSLISSGVLTYVFGRNFNSEIYNLTKAPTKMLSSFTYSEGINLEDVKDDSIMYIFGGDSDATKGGQADLNYINETIDWSNIVNNDNPESIGKYKYNENNTTYIVTWNLNGGTINGTTNNPKQNGITHGSTVSFVNYIPQRTGYTFEGWAETSSATSGKKAGNSDPITSNKTFYAIWKTTKKTYKIYMFAVNANAFSPHLNNINYLFIPNSTYTNVENAKDKIDLYSYTSFPCVSSDTIYTYFFVEETHKLTNSMLTGKTLKQLKDNYNLTKISGDMYEFDDSYTNNISDPNLVNEFNTIIHSTFGGNSVSGSNRVLEVWLYSYNGSTLYTNAMTSGAGETNVLNFNNPNGIYTIEV